MNSRSLRAAFQRQRCSATLLPGLIRGKSTAALTNMEPQIAAFKWDSIHVGTSSGLHVFGGREEVRQVSPTDDPQHSPPDFSKTFCKEPRLTGPRPKTLHPRAKPSNLPPEHRMLDLKLYTFSL